MLPTAMAVAISHQVLCHKKSRHDRMDQCLVVPVYEHRRCALAKAPLIVLDDWGFTALSAQDSGRTCWQSSMIA